MNGTPGESQHFHASCPACGRDCRWQANRIYIGANGMVSSSTPECDCEAAA